MQSNGTPCSCRALATAMPDEPAPMTQTAGRGWDMDAGSQKVTGASSFGPTQGSGALQRAPDLLGRPLPRPHRAVHVAQPVVGGLGPREVDAPMRRAQVRAVLGEDARGEMADRAAARPGLRRPVLLDELQRGARPLVAGEADEVVQHAPSPRARAQRRPLPVAPAADEREEDADAAVGRRVVPRHAGQAGVADALAAEPRLAPE